MYEDRINELKVKLNKKESQMQSTDFKQTQFEKVMKELILDPETKENVRDNLK